MSARPDVGRYVPPTPTWCAACGRADGTVRQTIVEPDTEVARTLRLCGQCRYELSLLVQVECEAAS